MAGSSLDLEWRGQAKTDVTISKYDYGGLFLRMPWREGIQGEVVNAARQRNARAEGQRAMWIDVGMQVEGRDDLAHIAIFDHPDNAGYPQPWRVDGQLGVGSARARSGDWTIKKGETEVIRHQFVVYTGSLSDVEMTNAWAAFAGNRSPYSTSVLWGIAQREGREAKFLTPEQAVAQMVLVDGFAVNAWAAEPMVTQPMAFCWDDRGRLWVAENRDYESRVQGFSNAGDSRILILEDTNRDGIADSRKVFMEGIVFPSALAVGFDGVFVGAPPNLLFVPDRNGDDKADIADIEVRLTGWGIQDRHETLNSLHWGPDGWLYGLQGYATASKIRKPTGKGRVYKHKDPFPPDLLSGDGVDINGGVWRYHPTRDEFEVVAHGFSNPWGIDYDAKGQLLISACVIPHLWHVIPGGIYHRQGGQHFNPYVYNDIKTIADHRHRSAHGGARVYQSDAFPPEQRGRIFMANIHEHAVLSDVLVPKGSGFTAHHGDDFLMANNAQWIGFSLEIGPDGALYVLDWHDGDICGQDVLHQETGRIYRIVPKTSLASQFDGRYSDLRQMSDAQLVALQTNPSDWHARRARIILQYRAAKSPLEADTHAQLRQIFATDSNPDWRLRAMWALHVTGGWTPDTLIDVLSDRDDYIRAWAIQLLCEGRSPSPRAIEQFVRMARDDRSPVVRLYLASALQRIDPAVRWNIATELLMHPDDADDQNLPTMLWLAVEPLVEANPALALDRAGRSSIPSVAQYIARRTVDTDAEGALDVLVSTIAKKPKTEMSLLEGMRDGLEGRIDLSPPPNWAATYDRLKRSDPDLARLGLQIAQQFGDTEAARQNLATVRIDKCAARPAPEGSADPCDAAAAGVGGFASRGTRRSRASCGRHPRHRGIRSGIARQAAHRQIQHVQPSRTDGGGPDAGITPAVRPAADRRAREGHHSEVRCPAPCVATAVQGRGPQIRRGVRTRRAERGRGQGLRQIPQDPRRGGGSCRQREERASGLPADVRRVPQDVRRRGHDGAGSHRVEPGEPGLPAAQRARSERGGAGRLQNGRDYYPGWSHVPQGRSQRRTTVKSRCGSLDGIRL